MNHGINFSKSKINKIRRNLYEIENEKNLFTTKIKETEKNLIKLEENLSKEKKYYDNEYKGITDLFDLSIDENYHRPIITNGAFNNNYIQYESRGNKDKILAANEFLHLIRPYVSDMINNHKAQDEWITHSGDTIIKHKTQSEWKIQLTMAINFISSKPNSEETTRTIRDKK